MNQRTFKRGSLMYLTMIGSNGCLVSYNELCWVSQPLPARGFLFLEHCPRPSHGLWLYCLQILVNMSLFNTLCDPLRLLPALLHISCCAQHHPEAASQHFSPLLGCRLQAQSSAESLMSNRIRTKEGGQNPITNYLPGSQVMSQF